VETITYIQEREKRERREKKGKKNFLLLQTPLNGSLVAPQKI
jgi:hypothetical protein